MKDIKMYFEYRDTKVCSAEVKKITPAMAEVMLNGNSGNRKINFNMVTQYAADMRHGNWKGENGEAIVISKTGHLINGQHRLKAVISANVTVNLLIITVKPCDGKGDLSSLAVIQDRGKLRTHSEITGISAFAIRIVGAMIRDLSTYGARETKNTALRAAIYYDLQESIDYFNSKCRVSKKIFSQASVHVALVLRLAQGHDHTTAYKSILTNKQDLPNAWHCWYSKMEKLSSMTKDDRYYVLALTWGLTEPGRDMDKLFKIYDVESRVNEMRTQFMAYCGESIHNITG